MILKKAVEKIHHVTRIETEVSLGQREVQVGGTSHPGKCSVDGHCSCRWIQWFTADDSWLPDDTSKDAGAGNPFAQHLGATDPETFMW